jgi:class 3 adenylate cyclase
MSEIDPRVETPLVDWSEVGVSGLLPTGTVTLLLADVEGSTRLWETQPEEMTDAIARLNEAVSKIVIAHDGVGVAAGPFGADPATGRRAQRRDSVAR